MGINKSTVYNWIKKLDEKLQNSGCTKENNVDETGQAEIIEMDELFNYIEAKKTNLRDDVGNKETAANRRF